MGTDSEFKTEAKQTFRLVRKIGAVGLEMGLAIAIGVYAGSWLDKKFDTAPILFWIGFVIGLCTAVKAVIDAVKFLKKVMNDNGPTDI